VVNTDHVGCHYKTHVLLIAKTLLLLVPLGVVDPLELRTYIRRDPSQPGGLPHTPSDSPVTPHDNGTLIASFFITFVTFSDELLFCHFITSILH